LVHPFISLILFRTDICIFERNNTNQSIILDTLVGISYEKIETSEVLNKKWSYLELYYIGQDIVRRLRTALRISKGV